MRPQPWHIVVVVVLILLLFGAGKLPSLARNLGKSMRIFKSEVEELRGDDARKDKDEDELDEPERRPRTREHDPREVDAREVRAVRRVDEDRSRRD